MAKLILCILAAVVVVYLVVAFYKSDSKFEEINVNDE